MSQEDLAKRMGGLSQQAISKWVAQNRVPRNRIPQLKEVLGPDAELVQLAEQQAWSYYEAPRDLMPTPRKSRESEAERMNMREFNLTTQMKGLLPEHLQPHADVSLRIGSSHRSVDYLSDNIAVELKGVLQARSIMNAASRAAVQLQVIKALQPSAPSGRKYVAALVVAGGDLPSQYIEAIQKITAEMALLGVVLLVTTEIEPIVDYIVATEEAAGETSPQDLFDE